MEELALPSFTSKWFAYLNYFLASNRTGIVNGHDDIEVLRFADRRRGERQTRTVILLVNVHGLEVRVDSLIESPICKISLSWISRNTGTHV